MQTTSNVFSVNTKSKSNPDPTTEKKTSLLILLEAAGVRFQKVKNPVHAHLWYMDLNQRWSDQNFAFTVIEHNITFHNPYHAPIQVLQQRSKFCYKQELGI